VQDNPIPQSQRGDLPLQHLTFGTIANNMQSVVRKLPGEEGNRNEDGVPPFELS